MFSQRLSRNIPNVAPKRSTFRAVVERARRIALKTRAGAARPRRRGCAGIPRALVAISRGNLDHDWLIAVDNFEDYVAKPRMSGESRHGAPYPLP
jgi:hypothetical protein